MTLSKGDSTRKELTPGSAPGERGADRADIPPRTPEDETMDGITTFLKKTNRDRKGKPAVEPPQGD